MSWPGIEHLERKVCACGELAMLPTDQPFLVIQPFLGFKVQIYAKCERCVQQLLDALAKEGITCGGFA